MTRSIIVELRPRLQACNIFIVAKECFYLRKLVKILIKTSSIHIIWISEVNKIVHKIHLPECKLIPHTLSALQVQNDSVSFRLQTEPISNIAGSFATEILTLKSEDDSNWLTTSVPCIIAGQTCTITCRCCKKEVSKGSITFRRVLPLPSAAWESEDWFCHRHSEESEEFKMGAKAENCLYGCCHIMCHASLLCSIGGDKGVVHCSRCLAWLGTQSEAGIKLWRCTVHYGEDCIEVSPLRDFVLILRDALSGSMGTLHRIVIETQLSEQETHYLLLWVMDTDLQLLVNAGETVKGKPTSGVRNAGGTVTDEVKSSIVNREESDVHEVTSDNFLDTEGNTREEGMSGIISDMQETVKDKEIIIIDTGESTGSDVMLDKVTDNEENTKDEVILQTIIEQGNLFIPKLLVHARETSVIVEQGSELQDNLSKSKPMVDTREILVNAEKKSELQENLSKSKPLVDTREILVNAEQKSEFQENLSKSKPLVDTREILVYVEQKTELQENISNSKPSVDTRKILVHVEQKSELQQNLSKSKPLVGTRDILVNVEQESELQENLFKSKPSVDTREILNAEQKSELQENPSNPDPVISAKEASTFSQLESILQEKPAQSIDAEETSVVIERESVLTSSCVMKLLYLPQQSCTTLVQLWQRDLQVQSLDVAKPMFHAGLEQLTKSTQAIPAPHRVTNSFFVAYLELQ